MTERMKERSRVNRECLKEYLAVWDAWQCPLTFPGISNGDELAKEYVALVRRMVAEKE